MASIISVLRIKSIKINQEENETVIDASIVRTLLNYDPITGILIWKRTTSNRVKVGDIAGSLDKQTGYIKISLNGTHYYAHRIIWLYQTGSFPQNKIDHKDLNRSNNIWDNLREATHAQNMENTPIKRTNKSGYKGVYLRRKTKWIAAITIKSKRIYIGPFKTKEEAHKAYVIQSKKYYGEFARSG